MDEETKENVNKRITALHLPPPMSPPPPLLPPLPPPPNPSSSFSSLAVDDEVLSTQLLKSAETRTNEADCWENEYMGGLHIDDSIP